MNYPTNRKSPAKHEVKKHRRNGRPVRNYIRGKGRSPPSHAQAAHFPGRHYETKRLSHGIPRYNVSIGYAGGGSERFEFVATSFPNAISIGLSKARSHKIPSVVRVEEVR